jgi:LPS sulfotransferase NodH
MANIRTEEFLSLFTGWVGARRVDQIANDLEVARQGGFRLPGKLLLILFAARSGSNFLGQLLSSTGWFREIGESCRPSQLQKVRDRYGLRDCHAAAQWMIDNRGTPHAFGLKAGALVLIAAAHLGLLEEMAGRMQIVHLKRRDRVAQAISMHKIRQGGRLHSLASEGRIFSNDDYDAAAISSELARIDVVEAQFASFLSLVGKEAATVYYEDLCTAPEAEITHICERLGLTVPQPFEPRVRLEILRDEVSSKWRDRFLKELRSDVTRKNLER